MPAKPASHRPPGYRPRQGSRDHDRRRGGSAARGYDHDWQQLRAAHLMAHPLCQDCLDADPPQATSAQEVHHREKVRDRPDLRLDPANLLSLCGYHHRIRTRRGE